MYVEIHGFKNGKPLPKWERIPETEIRRWIDEHPNLDCYFNTIQQFSSETKSVEDRYGCSLYLDFDHPLPEQSLLQARKFVEYILSTYGDICIKTWFSGSKGFHICIDEKYFGVEENTKLTYHWKYLVNYFAKMLNLTTVDYTLYSIPSMLRIENTINSKSGLYKIPISLYELTHLTIDQIKELAKQPRDFIEEEVDIQPIPELAKLYSQAKEAYERSQVVTYAEAKPVELNKELPPCIKEIFEKGGILKLGFRNQTGMVLSAYCKDADMLLPEAQGFIREWVKSIPFNSPMTSLQLIDEQSTYSARETSAMLTLKTVYSNNKYHFSCGSIKACGIDQTLCNTCKSIGEELKVVRLEDYALAENMGEYIVTEADLVGKDRKEMLIPKSVTGFCPHDSDKTVCLTCPQSNFFNMNTRRCERTINFSSKNRYTIDVADAGSGHIHTVISRVFGVLEKRCPLFHYDIEWMNAQVVYLAQKLNYDFNVIDKDSMRVQAILLQHGVELNRSYKMYGRVYSHPRTRVATFIIDKAEPSQAMLDTFMITKEETDELKVFQCGTSEKDIMNKISEIHNIYRDSFIYVFGREDLILAVDMVFHSARWINFQKQPLKAWLDILILGDSGQAKTLVVKRLMKYYSIGTMAAGETCSRTGLLYTIQTVKNEDTWVVFGLLPRCSGYLVCVDEIHDMPAQDFKQFTLVRSEGVVDVRRSAYGIAKCETRLISIANARTGNSLASYGYPVQAIVDIPCFTSLEDVRRWDYAVGLRAGDVSDNLINTNVNDIADINNPYTAELSRRLILWIWTRKPDQIIIDPITEQWVLSLAKQMSEEYIADIPLVESGDMRQKIIRTAVAFAGRTYNSPDGEHLIVTPDHVTCAFNMINRFYKSEGLDYWGYSDDRARVELTEIDIVELQNRFRGEFTIWQTVAHYLLVQNEFTKQIVGQSTGLVKEGVERLFTSMLNNRFLEVYKGGRFRKTPLGRKFLRGLIDSKKEDDF